MKYSIILSVIIVMFFVGFTILPGNSVSKLDDSQEEITVFAAASLADVLENIASDFERSNNVRVHFDYASSGLLRAKITAGAHADIYLAASEKDMDMIQDKGYLAKDKRRNFAGNSLVCVIPVNSNLQIGSPVDLLDESVRRIAIGDPDHVPAGIYTRESFRNMGQWNKLAGKFVPGANIRSTLAHVEMGVVDAAIVYASDTRISKRIKSVFAIPHTTHAPIKYTGCVLVNGSNPVAAEKFLDFLASSYAAEAFTAYGFEPTNKEVILSHVEYRIQ